MKFLTILAIFFLSSAALAGEVKKWTDENGNVHYGDPGAAQDVKGSETLQITDTYDQDSYNEGLKRHNETQRFADSLENERLAEEKKKLKTEKKPSSSTARKPARAFPRVQVPNTPPPVNPSLPINNHNPVTLPTRP